MQQLYVDGFIKRYARKAMYIQDITRHPYKHIIEHRLKIITFYDDYGATAATRAFSVSRATIYNWKSQLKANHGRLSGLAPASRRPHTMRGPSDYQWHKAQIMAMREAHPGLGKDKLKVLLDEDCVDPSAVAYKK